MLCDWTDLGSLFCSVGEAIAKPLLPIGFLGRTEERKRRFPRVRLPVLTKDDKHVGWENLTVFNVIRLYLNRIQYEMGSLECDKIIFEDDTV